MNLTDITLALNSHFNTQWANFTPVAWDNVEFDMDANPEFVSFTISFGSQNQASMGAPSNNIYRQRGIVSVRIFTTLNRGAKRAMQLADKVHGIFRSKTISGIVFFSPSTTVVGQTDGVFQVNVAVSFYVDAIY
jgi:hypothetical protein